MVEFLFTAPVICSRRAPMPGSIGTPDALQPRPPVARLPPSLGALGVWFFFLLSSPFFCYFLSCLASTLTSVKPFHQAIFSALFISVEFFLQSVFFLSFLCSSVKPFLQSAFFFLLILVHFSRVISSISFFLIILVLISQALSSVFFTSCLPSFFTSVKPFLLHLFFYSQPCPCFSQAFFVCHSPFNSSLRCLFPFTQTILSGFPQHRSLFVSLPLSSV